MFKERFFSSSLSRKRIQHLLELFYDSENRLGDPRNTIKVIEWEDEKYVVKSFKKPNFINQFVYRFIRKSKARRSYENAVYLTEKGIGTPQPVAYLEKLGIFTLKDSYYICYYGEHDFTFRELINDDSLQDKEQILKEFASFMYEMHEAGIYFLDHSPGNTLIKKTSQGYTFSLVDLNRMKFFDIPYDMRLKNFERLSPKKWMYDIMGKEYAKLSNKDAQHAIESMWESVQKFQDKFHRKKRFKKKLKGLFKS